ncbi:MAG: hypothetical protein ACOCV1_03640 [Bacillota bacterium]
MSNPKYRYNSLVLGDTLYLDLYAYNNNELVDAYSIDSVDIYFLDNTQKNNSNTDGRRIKASFSSSSVIHVETGHYRVSVSLDADLYEIGDYIDIWKVKFNSYDSEYYPIEQQFKVGTDLRETHGLPFVYDVDFSFSPKKIYYGSKRYLKVAFYPTVHSDIGIKTVEKEVIDKFYFNLKTTGNLYIQIEMIEGCNYNSEYPLMNIKTDPEWDTLDIRGDNEAYYLLDVTEDQDDYDLGIYAIQFKCEIQGQEIVSRKFYLQILN